MPTTKKKAALKSLKKSPAKKKPAKASFKKTNGKISLALAKSIADNLAKAESELSALLTKKARYSDPSCLEVRELQKKETSLRDTITRYNLALGKNNVFQPGTNQQPINMSSRSAYGGYGQSLSDPYEARLAPVGDNVRGARINLARGLQALIFKPGTRISDELLQVMIDLRSIPASWPKEPTPTPVSVYEEVMRLLSNFRCEFQNQILAKVLQTTANDRQLRASGLEKDAISVKLRSAVADNNLAEFNAILKGDFKIGAYLADK